MSRDAGGEDAPPIVAPSPSVFPVVGIGASAGGLEAATLLLQTLTPAPGAAFVLIQHLDPRHESSLAELLARSCAMPVVLAEDEMAVAVNHVYVLPPNSAMVLRKRRLHLTPRPTTREPPRPIDQFFESLAESGESQCIGVILSGTGTDGTLGLEAIKAVGGHTFAQDASAGYAGMPTSAIAAGCVDFVLSPQNIAREIERLGKHEAPRPIDAAEANTLQQLFALLKLAFGVDFARYRQPTIRRRIERRMAVHRKERLADYVEMVRDDSAALAALFQDVLIHVTSFFRDPATFAALSATALPTLLQGRSKDSPVRIWVPGCSTGEEVYSLAICLSEFLAERSETVAVKLFGTDVSEAVIRKARSGNYAESIADDVSAERLRQFFTPTDGGYQVNKSIRDLCVFARQDATRDPPFSNLDLISCRNMLIYLERALQQWVLPVFHYALRESGLLLLGHSESVGSLSDLFSVFDASNRIYVRKPVPTRPLFELSARDRGHIALPLTRELGERPASGLELQREADRVVLARYAPAGVVVDEAMEILQFRGETGAYLTSSPGKPSHNLLRMAREGLLSHLRAAIEESKSGDQTIRRDGVTVRNGDAEVRFNLVLIPIRSPANLERRFLLLFEETAVGDDSPEVRPRPRARRPEVIAEREFRLEQELEATKAHLHEVIERQEAGNQEVLAANEEVLSSNEELQSTNEELQTAKEELQATNEELMTINDELQARNHEAAQLNDDLTNLITSANIPIVMVDRDLRIRRITPQACKVLNLLPSDVGRPITDIQLGLTVTDLQRLLLEVVDTLKINDQEVQDRDGHWYSLSVRPYRTLENNIDGAVLSLSDIDAVKRSEHSIAEARDYAESIVMTVREPLVVLNGALRVTTANRSFHAIFGTEAAKCRNQLLWDLSPGNWAVSKLKETLERVRDTGASFEDFEVRTELPELGLRTLLLDGRRVHAEDDDHRLILVAMEDITESLRAAAAASALEQKLQETQKLESLGVLAGGIAHDFNNILTGILGYANLAELATPPSSPTRGYLERIEAGAQQAAELCAQMLAYAGRSRFAMKPVHLSRLVRETMQLLQLSVTKRARLVSTLASDLPLVNADPTQIRQVLMNLLLNASESMGEKGGRITVSTGQMYADAKYLAETTGALTLAAADYVYIEVADDGCGMSPEVRVRIFDPFFTTKFTGRGLGLAAVLGIVRGNGGALRVDSSLDHGSAFRLLLPPSTASAELRAVPTHESTAWRGEGTVLVVDDEVGVRVVAAGMLEQLGFRTMMAADGREGLATYRAHADTIRLVLLDLTMPEMGGEETCRALLASWPDARIVLMSGYHESELIHSLAHLGKVGYLSKPFRLADLVTKVRAALADDPAGDGPH